MRRVRFALLLIAVASVGCKNQSTTFSNPFLTPDRVPPPSTRLAPGTAQPYYPGDIPASAPVGGPAPGFTPNPTYAPSPQPQGAPQGSWNSYPQQAPPAATPYAPAPGVRPSSAEVPWGGVDNRVVPLGAEAVRVPEDSARLRFAGGPAPADGPPSPVNPSSSVQPSTAYVPQSPGDAAMPIQSILPTPDDPPASFASSPVTPRQVEIRALSANSYQGNPHTNGGPATIAATLPRSSDGFRAQGSRRRRAPVDDVVRPTLATVDATHPSAAATSPQLGAFGMGQQYEWLRGQLERSPVSGEWRIRYQRADEPPDQLGGSVIVANPQVLGNLQSGEMVVVRGQMHNLHYPNGATVPAYQLAVVQRQQQVQ